MRRDWKCIVLGSVAAMTFVAGHAAIAQTVCESMDQDQREINSMVRSWKNVYPVSSSFATSCFRDARTDGDRAACVATINAMTACPHDDCGWSTVDFFGRVTAIAARRSALADRRRQYSYCPSSVYDESEGI